jgi:hypothetical protein
MTTELILQWYPSRKSYLKLETIPWYLQSQKILLVHNLLNA